MTRKAAETAATEAQGRLRRLFTRRSMRASTPLRTTSTATTTLTSQPQSSSHSEPWV